MGVYWDNVTEDGISHNEIFGIEDEEEKGRPDEHEGKATLGGMSEFFDYKAKFPTDQSR